VVQGFEVLVRHYEACLDRHGSTPEGVDWPTSHDLEARFGVMLGILDRVSERPVLLDLGCGPGLLVDYLTAQGRLERLDYRGIDLSPRMIEAAEARWPSLQFACRDILADPLPDGGVDVILMNGVLTERRSLSQTRMIELAQALVIAAFKAARCGIVFNVMNSHVDWERDDLFYWPFDEVAAFLKRAVSRHYQFRADYGLYEYAVFVHHEAQRPQPLEKTEWWKQ
jgi:SAM-dependent methyltransferase